MASFLGLGKKKLTRIAIVDDESQFLELDATISASHEGTATITRHPVEEGSNVTDHIRSEPERVDIEGVVSDSPILILASLRAQPSVPGGNPRTRAVDAYDFLRGIKSKGQTVKITTTLRDYESMALSRLGVTQDKDSGNIVRLVMGFEEVVIATTQTADVPEPINVSRSPRVSNGKKPKAPATPKVAAKSSTLFDIFTAAGAFFGGG